MNILHETPNELLCNKINLLKVRREQELEDIKEQFEFTCEKLRPINLVKEVFKELTQSPDVKSEIGSAAIGITSGYLIKKILFQNSNNPIKNLGALGIQLLASNMAAKHSDFIKSTGIQFIQIIRAFLSKSDKHVSKGDTSL